MFEQKIDLKTNNNFFISCLNVDVSDDCTELFELVNAASLQTINHELNRMKWDRLNSLLISSADMMEDTVRNHLYKKVVSIILFSRLRCLSDNQMDLDNSYTPWKLLRGVTVNPEEMSKIVSSIPSGYIKLDGKYRLEKQFNAYENVILDAQTLCEIDNDHVVVLLKDKIYVDRVVAATNTFLSNLRASKGRVIDDIQLNNMPHFNTIYESVDYIQNSITQMAIENRFGDLSSEPKKYFGFIWAKMMCMRNNWHITAAPVRAKERQDFYHNIIHTFIKLIAGYNEQRHDATPEKQVELDRQMLSSLTEINNQFRFCASKWFTTVKNEISLMRGKVSDDDDIHLIAMNIRMGLVVESAKELGFNISDIHVYNAIFSRVSSELSVPYRPEYLVDSYEYDFLKGEIIQGLGINILPFALTQISVII